MSLHQYRALANTEVLAASTIACIELGSIAFAKQGDTVLREKNPCDEALIFGIGMNIFFDHVERGEPSPRQVYLDAQLKLPVLAYRLLAALANRKLARDDRRAAGSGA